MPDVFVVGDIVRALRDITFSDGSSHIQEHLYEVRPGETGYYNHPDNVKLYALHLSSALPRR